MYNRDFGGIKSEGQLYNMEQEYRYSQNAQNYQSQEPQEEAKEAIALSEKHSHRKGRSALGFLKNLNADDLILIGIGLLLLLDSEEENDMFVLIIALLLFF